MKPENLSDEHYDDLSINSGLDDSIIEASCIHSADADQIGNLLDRSGIDCGGMVIPYLTTSDPVFVRIKPDGIIFGKDGKPAKYLQRAGSESRLYFLPEIRDEIDSIDSLGLPLIIVEGEKKALKASQELFYKEPIALPIGLGGVWNWEYTKSVYNKKKDREEDRKYPIQDLIDINLTDRIVYICFDSDIERNPLVQEAEQRLAYYLMGRKAMSVSSIRLPKEYGKGIDDFFVNYSNHFGEQAARDKFKELISLSFSEHLAKYQVDTIRKLELHNKEKMDLIVQVIMKDQQNVGKLYNNSSGAYFYYKRNKRVYQVEEESYGMLLANMYGLYRNDIEHRNTLSKIEEACIFKGEKTKVRHFSHFENGKLYFYDNNGSIYVIEKNEITLRENGYDNILFKHRDVDEFVYIPNCDGYLDKYLFQVTNFVESQYSILNTEQQRFLFRIWLYSLWFPNLLPTKPILVMTGDYRSGKSTIQRLVGKLLFGSNFNVSTIQGEKDFLASVVNKYYLVYDNVDVNTSWIRNAIASLSTGFKVEIRKLYSNNEMWSADPICYLAMNSMTQNIYKRPDIASRLLIFRTKALMNIIPENILQENIRKYRNEIISEIMDGLSKTIPYITNDTYTYSGVFRLADFAALGIKLSAAFNKSDDFKLILDIIGYEQRAMPLEDNPLVEYLETWLARAVNPGKFISSHDLYVEFKRIADDNHIPFHWRSPSGLGQAITNSLENLKIMYKIESYKGSGNRTFFNFERRQ